MKNRSFLLGVALTGLCLTSIGQQLRSVIFWNQGYAHFTLREDLNLPKIFAGHTFAVEDTFPRLHDYSTAHATGSATVTLDGKPIMSLPNVPIWLGHDGVDRYGRHLSMIEFQEVGAKTWTMYVGRRLAKPFEHGQEFEILRLDDAGEVKVARYKRSQRTESFPVFTVVKELNDMSIEPYAFAFVPMSGEFLPYLLVWVGFIVGLTLMWSNRRERQKS